MKNVLGEINLLIKELSVTCVLSSSCCIFLFISNAVPSGSGAFQMPTFPSSLTSTLRGGGGANLRNALSSNFFFYFSMKLHKKDLVESL